jgi:hypothetical protein
MFSNQLDGTNATSFIMQVKCGKETKNHQISIVNVEINELEKNKYVLYVQNINRKNYEFESMKVKTKDGDEPKAFQFLKNEEGYALETELSAIEVEIDGQSFELPVPNDGDIAGSEQRSGVEDTETTTSIQGITELDNESTTTQIQQVITKHTINQDATTQDTTTSKQAYDLEKVSDDTASLNFPVKSVNETKFEVNGYFQDNNYILTIHFPVNVILNKNEKLKLTVNETFYNCESTNVADWNEFPKDLTREPNNVFRHRFRFPSNIQSLTIATSFRETVKLHKISRQPSKLGLKIIPER